MTENDTSSVARSIRHFSSVQTENPSVPSSEAAPGAAPVTFTCNVVLLGVMWAFIVASLETETPRVLSPAKRYGYLSLLLNGACGSMTTVNAFVSPTRIGDGPCR